MQNDGFIALYYLCFVLNFLIVGNCHIKELIMEASIKELLNDQIAKEFASAYLYLAISAYYEDESLEGFSHWFKRQASEELEHGMKIYDYLLENSTVPSLKTIVGPSALFKTPDEPLRRALEHERFVTDSIYRIYDEAKKMKDYKTEKFLDWFVVEQAEEELEAQRLVNRMKLFGQDAKGLYALDKELHERL